MKRMYVLLLMSMGCFAQGTLPEGFKFEPASDSKRTTMIAQLKRFEECQGDEACIAQLKELQQVIIRIQDNHITVENNSDADVVIVHDQD